MFGNEFFTAVGAVLSVVIMIGVGYALTAKGKITQEISKFLTWTVLNVSLPCMMASTILKNFKSEDLKDIPKAVAVPFFTILLCIGIGLLVAKISRPKEGRFGQIAALTALSNTIFMGLPVNVAMFGEQSVPYVLYYYIANTTVFWTLGVFCISGGKSRKGKNIFSILLTPPMFGLIGGILLLLLKIPVPKFAMDTLGYIGNLTTPLSMFFIGYVLCKTGLKNLKVDKDVIIGVVCRLGIGPAVSVMIYTLAGLPGMMHSVFTVQSFMPSVTSSAIIADQYGTDSSYASVVVTLSTLISLVLLPLVKIFLL